MAARKTKAIDEIRNMKKMVKLLEALDISCEDIETMEEMKTKAKEISNQSQQKARWMACQVRIL